MPTPKKGAPKAKGTTRGGSTGTLAPVVTTPSKDQSPKELYETIDWEAWYHEFATAVTRGGLPKYASTFAFAQEKGKSRQQRDTIMYIIGPKVQGRTSAVYNGIEQFEWDKRRKEGFWLGPETLLSQIKKITDKQDTVEELRASGQAYLLPLIATLAGMMDKIEASFSGQLFMPNLSGKANEARAALYMRLVDHVTTGIIRLQEAYARSLMVNFNDMPSTILMREHMASKMNAETEDKRNGTMFKIIDMMADKGRAMNLPLPDSDIGKIVAREQKAPVT